MSYIRSPKVNLVVGEAPQDHQVSLRAGVFFFTQLSVVAKPLSATGFKANSGIKIPLEIVISDNRKGIFLANVLEIMEQKIPVKYLFGILIASFVLLFIIIVFLQRKVLR